MRNAGRAVALGAGLLIGLAGCEQSIYEKGGQLTFKNGEKTVCTKLITGGESGHFKCYWGDANKEIDRAHVADVVFFGDKYKAPEAPKPTEKQEEPWPWPVEWAAALAVICIMFALSAAALAAGGFVVVEIIKKVAPTWWYNRLYSRGNSSNDV